MLSSSCDLKHWFQQKTRHAIIIVWFRQTHRHAITNEMSTKARPFTRIARTPLSHDLHARTTFNTTDAMLFFYGNIVMLSSSCDLSDRHMLWIRQAHRHAIIMLSSMIHHLVSSTDTSPCYHECHARPFTRRMLSLLCDALLLRKNSHAIIIVWFRHAHHPIIMLSMTPVIMLSSSCEFDRDIVMLLPMRCRPMLCSPNEDSGMMNSKIFFWGA